MNIRYRRLGMQLLSLSSVQNTRICSVGFNLLPFRPMRSLVSLGTVQLEWAWEFGGFGRSDRTIQGI